jgi:hypothetical protein
MSASLRERGRSNLLVVFLGSVYVLALLMAFAFTAGF